MSTRRLVVALIFAATLGTTSVGVDHVFAENDVGTTGGKTHFRWAPSARCSGRAYGRGCGKITHLPRSDAYCARAVTKDRWEPRPENFVANHTVFTPPFGWTPDPYWSGWVSNENKVTGNFTGTTNQILQWAACKWGIGEDTVRAVAVEESWWRTSSWSDRCGNSDRTRGIGSYGIMQVKALRCDGAAMHGGYPFTAKSTALSADWYGARIRSCYDGLFPGWLYGGGTVAAWAKTRGWISVRWGCVGFHFSGGWDPAQSYVTDVKTFLANRTWRRRGF